MIIRILTAALCLLPAALVAQPLEEEVTSFLSERGFADIELVRYSGTLKAIASGEGRLLEVVYNAATGEIISQEMSFEAPVQAN